MVGTLQEWREHAGDWGGGVLGRQREGREYALHASGAGERGGQEKSMKQGMQIGGEGWEGAGGGGGSSLSV